MKNSLQTSLKRNIIAIFSRWIFVTVFGLCSVVVYAQEVTISGTVKDSDTGELLVGVTILESGTANGTVTDIEGKFSLRATSDNAILQFSSIGYATQEVAIAGRSVIDISLMFDIINLAEVVVVGYGTTKKSDLTGSVSSLDTKNLNTQSSPNPMQFMQGKVAGVQVVENSGAPGDGINIQIRGFNSINASSSPLYVVDGIPFVADGANDLRNSSTGGFVASPLAALNPNDIASIEILKDGSATAIYGSRGANGVVLITTKKGTEGKARINVSISTGVSELARKIELLNGPQYAELANEAATYRLGEEPDFNIPFTEQELATLPDFDHQDAVFDIGRTQDVNVSISGGNGNSSYYVSGQYFDQEGILPGTGLEKYNLNLRLQQELSDKFTFDANAKILRSSANGAFTGGFLGGQLRSTLTWAPTVPLRDANGNFVNVNGYQVDRNGNIKDRFAEGIQAITDFSNNPIGFSEDYESVNTTDQLFLSLQLSYEINEHLKANLKYGFTNNRDLLESYRATTLPFQGRTFQGYANIGNARATRSLYETTLNYNNTFGLHNVSGVIGFSAEDIVRKTNVISAEGFLQDITGFNDIESAVAPQQPSSSFNDNALASVLGRINYNYDSRYFATFSARYDGSSKFAEGNRWGFFPSLGVSWKIDQESFLEDVISISELKLRASIGVSGNQAIPSYQTLGQFFTNERQRTNFNFGNEANIGYAPARIPNQDLTWERTEQTNIGLDFGMFGNRITITADAYRKDTRDLLFRLDLPSTSGFTSIFTNVGQLRNEGIELSLSTVNIETNDFQWTTSANISWNTNTIQRLSGREDEQFIAGTLFQVPLSILSVGSSVGEFYGLKTDGIWDQEALDTKPDTFMPAARPGDRRYADVNGDGVLSADDRVLIGNSIPQFTGGFSTGLTYKNWNLFAALSFSYGNDMFNQLLVRTLDLRGGTNASTLALDRWRPITSNMTAEERERQLAINATTNVPRAGNFSQTQEVSDAYIEDASFLRLNNLSLSYTLPKVPDNISNIKVTASVENLFTITGYSGFSPTGSSNGAGLIRGVDNGLYPLMRSYRLSLIFNL